jgi:hypothetical protein
MHPLVVSKQQQVAALCRSRGVRRLELFGSAARDDFDAARSDLDFFVDLGDDPTVSPLDAYFGLKDDLETLFNRPVDLVSDGAVRNPYVMASIQRDRQLLYAA